MHAADSVLHTYYNFLVVCKILLLGMLRHSRQHRLAAFPAAVDRLNFVAFQSNREFAESRTVVALVVLILPDHVAHM